MRVLVTGGTGVLGRRLVPHLRKLGHEVVILARSAENERIARELGAEPARGSLYEMESIASAAKGAHAIVHAATAIPTVQRPLAKHWRENDRIRRDGTRNVVEAARRVGAKRVVFQSIAWLARQPDGSPFDESSPIHTDHVTRSAADGEAIVRDAARHGIEGVTLRCGFFYAPESAHARGFRDAFRAGRLPIVGDGTAVIPLLHVEDAARAFAVATERAPAGTWHVVDDEPVAVRAFFDEFARRAGGPRPRSVPKWLARLAIGSSTTDFLTIPAPTSSARFREATGWTPTFPTYREGLDDLFATWAREP